MARMRPIMVTMLTTNVPMLVSGNREHKSNTVCIGRGKERERERERDRERENGRVLLYLFTSSSHFPPPAGGVVSIAQ